MLGWLDSWEKPSALHCYFRRGLLFQMVSWYSWKSLEVISGKHLALGVKMDKNCFHLSLSESFPYQISSLTFCYGHSLGEVMSDAIIVKTLKGKHSVSVLCRWSDGWMTDTVLSYCPASCQHTHSSGTVIWKWQKCRFEGFSPVWWEKIV